MILQELNMATIMLVLLCGHLFSGGLVIAYTLGRTRSKPLDTFLLSKLLQPIAWILIGIRGQFPGMLLVAIANDLLFIGAALEMISLLLIKESFTDRFRKNYLTLLAACALVFSAAAMFGAPEELRVALSSACLALLMALPAWRLFTRGHPSVLQRTISAFYGVNIVLLMLRAVGALATDYDLGLLTPSIFNTALFVLLFLHLISGSMGFILLDKEKLDAELLRAASVDGLTDTLNRQSFEKRAGEMIALFARRQEPVSCLLLDIDDFKQVNDTHGHVAGDEVLRQFALTIKGLLRNYDLLGRYGGEEFAILLPGADSVQAMEIAQRLRGSVEAMRIDGNELLRCTVSIGVSTMIPGMDTKTEHFYRLSDKALYHAKDLGKNRVTAA